MTGSHSHTTTRRTSRFVRKAAALLAALATSCLALAHGDVTPQAVDTKDLPQLGEQWRAENPYRKNEKAVRIGTSAYNQNCARCHGSVGLSMLPFHADENMADDLRNVVWRGHFLGWGPADVLMHVPVDPPLMQANPRVQILVPYYRERVAIAWRKEVLPRLESLADLHGRPVAVAGQPLAGWLLIGAEQGALRESLQTRLPDGVAAAQALQRGEVVAAGGLASELESALHGDDPMQALQAGGRVQELFRAHHVAWHL